MCQETEQEILVGQVVFGCGVEGRFQALDGVKEEEMSEEVLGGPSCGACGSGIGHEGSS